MYDLFLNEQPEAFMDGSHIYIETLEDLVKSSDERAKRLRVSGIPFVNPFVACLITSDRVGENRIAETEGPVFPAKSCVRIGNGPLAILCPFTHQSPTGTKMPLAALLP